MSNIQLKSPNNKSFVQINNGELISYQFNNEELIHQKGNPGWRNSDTEMFPIIGPTAGNNFTVSTPKGNYSQDQHGHLRELTYSSTVLTAQSCLFTKKYTAYSAVENSKYPEKSSVRLVSWPYNFTFKKTFHLSNNALKISFEIVSEKGMPFMFGYHPAFMLNGNLEEMVTTHNHQITIPEIINGGDTATPILNTLVVSLIKSNGYNIKIETSGFKHFMLWTPVKNMLCIEPITAYPYAEGKLLSEKLFNKSNGVDTFEVEIKPFY
jgi:galactose mutarotase-like enzyme